MFVDLAGQHIADIMTMNRSLSGIPSASAILDTSNYTFQAISYGKDADGFRNHAHVILSPSSDGIIKVISYQSSSFSGYTPLETAKALNTYDLYPASPTPMDIRLELKSTLPNYSGINFDLGQCLNTAISQSLSSYSHLIGCFPAASGSTYKIFTSSNELIVSGITASSMYNLNGIMDISGFLTFNSFSLSQNKTYYTETVSEPSSFKFGVIRSAESDFPLAVDLKWILPSGECGTLNLFGGVYHLGLWCLDIKSMLKEGNMPPYSFNPLNNVRRYKLFCKKTFNRDLTYYPENDAFKELFENSSTGWDTYGGIVLNWKIRFV